MFYSGNLFITGIGSSNHISECSPIEKSVKLAQYMAFADTVVTMFVLNLLLFYLIEKNLYFSNIFQGLYLSL
jgi:hypothetical protein